MTRAQRNRRRPVDVNTNRQNDALALVVVIILAAIFVIWLHVQDAHEAANARLQRNADVVVDYGS